MKPRGRRTLHFRTALRPGITALGLEARSGLLSSVAPLGLAYGSLGSSAVTTLLSVLRLIHRTGGALYGAARRQACTEPHP